MIPFTLTVSSVFDCEKKMNFMNGAHCYSIIQSLCVCVFSVSYAFDICLCVIKFKTSCLRKHLWIVIFLVRMKRTLKRAFLIEATQCQEQNVMLFVMAFWPNEFLPISLRCVLWTRTDKTIELSIIPNWGRLISAFCSFMLCVQMGLITVVFALYSSLIVKLKRMFASELIKFSHVKMFLYRPRYFRNMFERNHKKLMPAPSRCYCNIIVYSIERNKLLWTLERFQKLCYYRK